MTYEGGYGAFVGTEVQVNARDISLAELKTKLGRAPGWGDEDLRVSAFTCPEMRGVYVVEASTYFRMTRPAIMATSGMPEADLGGLRVMGRLSFLVVRTGPDPVALQIRDLIDEIREAVNNDDGSDPPVVVCKKCQTPRAWDQIEPWTSPGCCKKCPF